MRRIEHVSCVVAVLVIVLSSGCSTTLIVDDEHQPIRNIHAAKDDTAYVDAAANNDCRVQTLYEEELAAPGSNGRDLRLPDFTVHVGGEVFYWEHCGMLTVPEYAERWERKLEWYRQEKVLPLEGGGGERATLIVTRDDPQGGIDSAEIRDLIGQVF